MHIKSLKIPGISVASSVTLTLCTLISSSICVCYSISNSMFYRNSECNGVSCWKKSCFFTFILQLVLFCEFFSSVHWVPFPFYWLWEAHIMVMLWICILSESEVLWKENSYTNSQYFFIPEVLCLYHKPEIAKDKKLQKLIVSNLQPSNMEL